MRERARSLGPPCLVVTLGLVGLAACGGSSDSSSSSTTTSTTTTKAAATSSDEEIATAASVAPADLGAGWTEFQKAGGFTAVTKESCNVQFSSPLTAGDEAYSGPMSRDQTEQVFIYTTVIIFETESQAKAFTTMRNTKEFKDCKEAEDDAAEKKRDPKSFVRLDGTPGPALRDGLESFYQEEAGFTDADGKDVVNASYARYTVRKGRVVYTVSMDTGLPADTAAAQRARHEHHDVAQRRTRRGDRAVGRARRLIRSESRHLEVHDRVEDG